MCRFFQGHRFNCFHIHSYIVLLRWECCRLSTEASTLTTYPTSSPGLVARIRKPFSTVHNSAPPHLPEGSLCIYPPIARGQFVQIYPQVFSRFPFYSLVLLWSWGCCRLSTQTMCSGLVARILKPNTTVSNSIPPCPPEGSLCGYIPTPNFQYMFRLHLTVFHVCIKVSYHVPTPLYTHTQPT